MKKGIKDGSRCDQERKTEMFWLYHQPKEWKQIKVLMNKIMRMKVKIRLECASNILLKKSYISKIKRIGIVYSLSAPSVKCSKTGRVTPEEMNQMIKYKPY